MAAARSWTTDDDHQLVELHAAGTTLTACARTMQRPRSGISKASKRLALTWDRTRTAEATRAKVVDAKARRADLALKILEDAERLRAQLWQPVTVFNFGGKDNTFAEHTLNQPPHADQLKLVQAVSTAVNAYGRLEQMDADQGVEAAVGMLDAIAAAITAAERTLPEDART